MAVGARAWRAAGALAAIAGASACGFDLFHDTSWQSRCQIAGAETCAPGGGGASGGGASPGGAATSTAASGEGARGGGGSDSGAHGAASSSASGDVVSSVGCADGEREGFMSPEYVQIAACAGGWSVAGITGALAPACAHAGGDDGVSPSGAGCSAADLCAAGWHVCASAAEVASKSPTGDCSGLGAVGGVFFATGQSGPGTGLCGAGANDVFGCGSLGHVPDPISCAPLDRFSDDLCVGLGAPWSCGADVFQEATAVTKTGSDGGGVLCCTD